ncbi:phosphoenolpyruvate carboxykinase (ATP) [Risungbinella massiliensis]|uniref:hypothetical protein n=1 Tax=Risungbinella massiliensis TaxID=1329796 RepID=UPI0005CC3FE2|nr:hypothetical protein [Risungbinella massiliensis]
MNYYKMYGLVIKTKLDLSDYFYECGKSYYDFEIVCDDRFFNKDLLNQSKLVFRRFIVGEAVPFKEVYKVGNSDYFLRWLTKYQFFIDPFKRRLIMNSELDEEFFAIFFSKITSFLLYLKGHSQLHGSAVRYRNKTICFIGDSGTGKSTIASLCALAGGKIITDDIIALAPETYMVRSGIPSMRLSESSPLVSQATRNFGEIDKLRVDVSQGLHYKDDSFIDGFFFLKLDDTKGLVSKRLKGNETIMHLLSNVYAKHFLKHVFSEVFYDRNLPVFTRLSCEVPMFRVYRDTETNPESLFSLIDELVNQIS